MVSLLSRLIWVLKFNQLCPMVFYQVKILAAFFYYKKTHGTVAYFTHLHYAGKIHQLSISSAAFIFRKSLRFRCPVRRQFILWKFTAFEEVDLTQTCKIEATGCQRSSATFKGDERTGDMAAFCKLFTKGFAKMKQRKRSTIKTTTNDST